METNKQVGNLTYILKIQEYSFDGNAAIITEEYRSDML
jgi:hypothetical protein